MVRDADVRGRPEMAIDGRELNKGADKADAYESAWVRALSAALVWVPLALVVVLAYLSGTWIGGVWGGAWSVVGAVLTALAIWVYRRFFSRHRR
jgi:uncharacterized membrane protein YdjX (TVP38/TMEM64 family)